MLMLQVSTDWLMAALLPLKKKEILPQLVCDNHQLSIKHFYNGGAGLRIVSTTLPAADNMSFEISDSLQRFLACCSSFSKIELKLEQRALTLSMESLCSALQYKIPYVKKVEDMAMQRSNQDVELQIPTEEWFHIFRTLPVKGNVTIGCCARKRAVTLKHSKGRWVGGVHAKSTSSKTLDFECTSAVAKAVFKDCQITDTFSSLIFMENGVLCWMSGGVTVYLAPNIE